MHAVASVKGHSGRMLWGYARSSVLLSSMLGLEVQITGAEQCASRSVEDRQLKIHEVLVQDLLS